MNAAAIDAMPKGSASLHATIKFCSSSARQESRLRKCFTDESTKVSAPVRAKRMKGIPVSEAHRSTNIIVETEMRRRGETHRERELHISDARGVERVYRSASCNHESLYKEIVSWT